MKVWNYLNGKKTVIGTALGVLYAGLLAMGLIERNETVEWVIVTVFGVGVSHKVVKVVSNS